MKIQKRFIEECVVEKIAKKCNVSLERAKELYKNCLIYDVVIEAILEQAEFLSTHQIDLM